MPTIGVSPKTRKWSRRFDAISQRWEYSSDDLQIDYNVCDGAECARTEGVGSAERNARTAKQPQGPAPAYVLVSG